MGVLWSKIDKVLSEKIQREQLKPGDHIYTWRQDNSISHGIYVGDGDVIHLADQQSSVLSTSIVEFLGGGKLYLFEYGVNPYRLLIKPRRATCIPTHITQAVKCRASLLLENGFRVHHCFKNNSEAFAVFCKTGLLSLRVSRSQQARSLLMCFFAFCKILQALPFSITLATGSPTYLAGWVAIGGLFYCTCRGPFDIRGISYGCEEYGVERYAQEEVKNSIFEAIGMAAMRHYVIYIGVNIFFAVASAMLAVLIVFNFIGNVIISIFGDGGCLTRSWWTNYSSITSTNGESRENSMCVKMAGVLWSKIERVLSKYVQREQLKPGDHIYTWRPDNSKSHGIYFSDEKVIHFTPRQAGQEDRQSCCVVSTGIDDFLEGGELYIFEYGVNPVLFLAKPQGGATCTLVGTDRPEVVERRVSFLLEGGFHVHHPYKNSEDFAVYCKTGLLSICVSRSEQAAPLLACAVFFLLIRQFVYIFKPAILTGWAATVVIVYCTCRLASDIGARPNNSKNKVAVEGLAQVEVREVGFLTTLMAWLLVVLIIWIYLMFEVPERIMLFCWAIFQRNFNFRSWVLFNKVRADQLQPGDHIYTWRGYTYTHHGIYMGNEKVIHIVRGPGSSLFRKFIFCPSNDKVLCIELNDFVSGGELYRYEYGVKLGYFIANIRGGTCTLASSDPSTDVQRRANFLLHHYEQKKGNKTKVTRMDVGIRRKGNDGFGAYHLLANNCEDFALYCKTGLLSPRMKPSVETISGQAACPVAAFFGIFFFLSFPYPTSNLIRVPACYCIYSALRIFFVDQI